ncbi:MAG: MFS transporter, partial [Ornithinibacter sp.]
AVLLYGTERLGKAVRSPAKDTLLSHASTRTGSGSAFGVHQAMDQFGAMAGPLLLAAILAQRDGDYRLAFGVLIVPGVLVLAVLAWLRLRVPDPLAYETRPNKTEPNETEPNDSPPQPDAVSPPDERTPARTTRPVMPRQLWEYVTAIAMLSCGVASFPLLAFHAQTTGLLSAAQVPVLFAVAMFVDGLTGPIVGRLYDRHGAQVMLVVPFAAAGASVAFTDQAWLVWTGVAIWGVVNGVLDSTVKAVVTQLVGPEARAVAFGWLALSRGIGLLIAGGILGVAYDHDINLVIVLLVLANAVALLGLRRVVGSATHPAPD